MGSKFVSLALCVATGIAFGPRPTTALVSQLNVTSATGETFTFDSQHPELPTGEIVEICVNGLWILFGQQNYGYEAGIGVITGPLEICAGFSIPGGSVRPAGVLGDYTVPSATFFSKFNFGGDSAVIVGGVTKLNFPVESIVTINTNVELFLEENFQGDSYCADICTEDVLIPACAIGSEWENPNLPWKVNLAKSARIGCSIPGRNHSASVTQSTRKEPIMKTWNL